MKVSRNRCRKPLQKSPSSTATGTGTLSLLLEGFYGVGTYKQRTSSAKPKIGRRCLAMRCGGEPTDRVEVGGAFTSSSARASFSSGCVDKEGADLRTGAAAASRRGDAAAASTTSGGSPKSGLVRRRYCSCFTVGRLGLLEGGVRAGRGFFARWRGAVARRRRRETTRRRAARDSSYLRGLWLFLHTGNSGPSRITNAKRENESRLLTPYCRSRGTSQAEASVCQRSAG